jgi:hypothetical protein
MTFFHHKGTKEAADIILAKSNMPNTTADAHG